MRVEVEKLTPRGGKGAPLPFRVSFAFNTRFSKVWSETFSAGVWGETPDIKMRKRLSVRSCGVVTRALTIGVKFEKVEVEEEVEVEVGERD